MKIITKRITVGDYDFDISTDRDIAVKAFEQFPDFAKYVFSNANLSEKQFLESAIDNKELSKVFDLQDQEKDLVLYAFPYMYAKANPASQDGFIGEFLTFIEENGVMDVFVEKVFEFLMLGFSQKEKATPKVKFSLK